MDPLLMDTLGIEIGDTFRLGTQDFRLMAALTSEPDATAGGFGLGPRSIRSPRDLAGSGLLAPGTLFTTRYRLDLPQGADLAADRGRGRQCALAESGMRWRDARNGAPGVAEFVDRLGAFLILVGLSGLAVGGVGISAAIRAYLAGKTEVIATLRTLGAGWRTIVLLYLFQIGLLGLAGSSRGLWSARGCRLLWRR